MTRILPATLLATIAFALPASANDALLARLVGSWTGHGTYRQSTTTAPEPIFCKVTNTLVNGGTALQQLGRCSVASNSGPIDGIISTAGGGRYTGHLASLASEGPASFSGTGGGDRLTLSMTFVDARTHEAAASVTTMTISGNGYRLTTTRKDGGKSWTATEIRFTK